MLIPIKSKYSNVLNSCDIFMTSQNYFLIPLLQIWSVLSSDELDYMYKVMLFEATFAKCHRKYVKQKDKPLSRIM